jgi:predicted aminopeptidase
MILLKQVAMFWLRRTCFILPLLFAIALLTSCSDSAYLLHVAKGQWSLMTSAESIDDILTHDTERHDLREQLSKVVTLREFAVSSLGLPDNGSYREYADLERPYAVWNVVVAPELSLKLNEWCFPVAGCVTYRGYFDEQQAQTTAKAFSDMGFDVDVYGVEAYSTLNWFDDPVLNTFLDNDDIQLAGLLFHEMSHQVIYVQNDTVFNESFAKTVELEGLRRWFDSSDSQELWQECLQREKRSADFHKLLAKVRSDLTQAYASEQGNDQKRIAKEQILHSAVDDYESLKEHWNGYAGYDLWVQRGLNNARLSSAASYYELVPAFQTLLLQSGNDLENFYAEVKKLGALPKDERLARLKSLSPSLRASLN